MTSKTPIELVAAIYDAQNPNGWQWSNLTSGEAQEARVTAEWVLDAVPVGWIKTDDGWQKIESDKPDWLLRSEAARDQYNLDAAATQHDPEPPDDRIGAE